MSCAFHRFSFSHFAYLIDHIKKKSIAIQSHNHFDEHFVHHILNNIIMPYDVSDSKIITIYEV